MYNERCVDDAREGGTCHTYTRLSIERERKDERKIEQRRYRMLSSSWSLVASYRRGEDRATEPENQGDEFCNQLSNFSSFFSRSLVLQPRPKKAINRYPSPRSFLRARVTYTRCGPWGADVCARSCGRTSFGRYRAIAEWVMHPAKAWGHQMNYDISFSHPYIYTLRPLVSPTRLIAFNSLLVHSNTIASFRAFLSSVSGHRRPFPDTSKLSLLFPHSLSRSRNRV